MPESTVNKALLTEAEREIVGETLSLSVKEYENKNPTVIEIGTYKAEGSKLIVEFLNKIGVKSRFMTFDIPYKHPRKRPFTASSAWASKCWGEDEESICHVEFHEMPGSEGHGLLGPEDSVVWVLIDGCHCYQCVRADFNAWHEHLKPGGFILFHDCSEKYPSIPDQLYHGDRRPFGVYKFVKKSGVLSSDYELFKTTEPEIRKDKLFGGMHVYKKLK